jgi:hypothetical protein
LERGTVGGGQARSALRSQIVRTLKEREAMHPQPDPWEYRIGRVDTSGVVGVLARDGTWRWTEGITLEYLGIQCWELVGVGPWEGNTAMVVFKRRKVPKKHE